MVIRVASIVLTLAGLLSLLLGCLFWTGAALHLIALHMLLGFLTVGALLVVGIGQAFFHGGSWLIAFAAVFAGAVMVILGLFQATLMVGSLHWLIQVTHLALGLLTIGLGHMGAARYRKGSKI